ncbi:MAG: hypothetical protein ACTSP7_00170 [Candidatus Heimdallarchaeota archaeon]
MIRAKEFSVRKLNTHTVYAKTISLTDPNFSRKNRQFGIAIITSVTIEIEEAEQIINNIFSESIEKCNNQSYFKMLNGLLEIISNDDPFTGKDFVKDQKKQILNDKVEKPVKNPFLEKVNQRVFLSEKLSQIKSVKLTSQKEEYNVVIRQSLKSEPNQVSKQGEQLEFATEKYAIRVEMTSSLPDDLQFGLEIFSRIIEPLSTLQGNEYRLLVGVEFFDRLLAENIDIHYYLPFIQYLITMEQYTITEFKNEEFANHLPDLMTTHGEWIDCLNNNELDGLSLTKFFGIVKVKRESLEFLIDLLFMKLIKIFN